MKSFLVLFFIICFIGIVSADIDLSNGYWNSTFDCDEWEYPAGGLSDCDTFSPGSGNVCNGIDTQITTNASMRDGSRGMRQWIGDGANNGSRGLYVDFDTQQEVWIRWYHRYQENFTWGGAVAPYPHYDKLLYVDVVLGRFVIPEPEGQTFRLCVYNGSESICYPGLAEYGWDNVSDGEWHYYEVYLNTSGSYKMWLDDDLIVDVNNSMTYPIGIQRIQFGSNQDSPENHECFYEDFDEIVISTTGYVGPLDYSVVCGDGSCNGVENCSNCFEDCGECVVLGEDLDLDGFNSSVDCNDTNENVSVEISCSYNGTDCGSFSLCVSGCPSAPIEVCGNGIDEDCAGSDLVCGGDSGSGGSSVGSDGSSDDEKLDVLNSSGDEDSSGNVGMMFGEGGVVDEEGVVDGDEWNLKFGYLVLGELVVAGLGVGVWIWFRVGKSLIIYFKS